MAEVLQSSYEELPYVNRAFYYTHPDWLGTVATLFGMQPAPADHCRVLDLGCAAGGNILPMALSLPNSQFVGIDLSPRQIASGQAVLEALGLGNIELKAMSILEVDESLGLFDYIICHGVYSWVPSDVQDKVLAICAQNLAPQGVAYVSYNTYPGWHLRGMVREMLCFHVMPFAEPQARVQQARALLDFLVRAVPDTSPYGRILREEAEFLQAQADAYVFHEHLEEVNQPFYFYQFVERAAAKKLQYLEEATFNPVAASRSPELMQMLAQLAADPLAREQYLDFISRRTFRRTLLCHDHVVKRPPSPDMVADFYVCSVAKPEAAQADIHSNAVEVFRVANVGSLSTNQPAVKAALLILSEIWPRAPSFPALWDMVLSRLGEVSAAELAARKDGPRPLAQVLLQCYFSNLVELYRHVPHFVVDVGERPVASPLARLQVQEESRITNLRHRGIELSDFDRLVLRRLDGSRDRAALLKVLAELVATNELTIYDPDRQPVREPAQVRKILSESLELSLQGLARYAFLVG